MALMMWATSPWYQGLVLTKWGSQAPAPSRVRLRVYWRGGQVRVGPRLEGGAVTFTFGPAHKKNVSTGFKSYSLEYRNYLTAALR
jgi:hypothetical protein